jgi:intracellular sulfur oxidation DsrE/DsrF family protein
MLSLLNRLISILTKQRMKQHLVSRKISADKLLMEAKVVPSGVAEVAKLQANDKFVYLRP